MLLACCRTESLSVRVPFSDRALTRVKGRRRMRWVAGAVAVASAAMALSDTVLLANVWLTVAVGAAVVGFVTHDLLYFDGLSVDLDASRRWVTIRGLHDRFADAVAGRPVASDR